MKKLLFIPGLFLVLLGGNIIPSTASAKSLPKLSTRNVTYTSSRLNAQVKTPQAAKLLAVKYGHRTNYYNLKKNSVAISYKFSGYNTFKLYGTSKAHQRVTQVAKLSSSDYATTEVIDFGEVRTATGASITVNTLDTLRTVRLFSGNQLLQTKNTGNGKQAVFTLPLSQYKSNLTYTVTAPNKKSTQAFEIPYLKKPSNLDVIE
ncbi:hypothetical protein [Secundilactobacillus silagei]|uniref:Uncharacterized protein n=1 Tax=Secundilactobacillus silagei JCM 19001 TaxID=1302250 RepID=A0A1Z5IK13_9LACO|nr:hypothetical protein [Secundilactobacillus silagei]TDG69889.1 hypothetical protein C5L25_002009 [Secundilactobacillus silagei JCM 19001]GAX02117.1 hypothetical protein IWT126_02181 [Secundilactobacillus silagei JCM 19001]